MAPTQRVPRLAAGVAALVIAAILGASSISNAGTHATPGTTDYLDLPGIGDPATDPAVEAPALAWELILKLTNDGARGDLPGWMSWISAEAVFADPDRAPLWPTSSVSQLPPSLPPKDERSGVIEDTRFNRRAFEWIVTRSIWHLDGQEMYQERVTRGKPVDLGFPLSSAIVKSAWAPVDSSGQLRRLQVATNRGRQQLVAVHLAVKIRENWFWATWEPCDSPTRARSAHEIRFEQAPRSLLSDPSLSPGARLLLTSYCLNGTQQRFTDLAGRPSILANSVLEAGITDRSSCMTCHAFAGVGPGGTHPKPTPVVGVPKQDWYGEVVSKESPFAPLDFVLALRRARPRSSGSSHPAPLPQEATGGR